MTEGKRNQKQAGFAVKTFTIPFSLGKIKENITINTNTHSKPSKEQITNQAFEFHLQGNTIQAAKLYQYLINQDFNDHRVFSNYGVILIDLGKLQDAELSTRKAIQIKPDFADAHSNLGNILKDLGKLEEAELFTRKAIEIKPDFANAHYNLGNILSDLGKLKDAELSYRKAIEIKPDYAKAYSNLGNILRDIGKSQEARLCSEKIMSIRSWSIAGSYNINYDMKLD